MKKNMILFEGLAYSGEKVVGDLLHVNGVTYIFAHDKEHNEDLTDEDLDNGIFLAFFEDEVYAVMEDTIKMFEA